ncbi:phytoene desaturase family protein [Luteimicrobium xylanilyticum]|uniref:All-trans-zeta-carotene desaturase n=1 Tax=Luteimicrobium xylanilyticum TaxID=1133546 RepID=A0A5P9QCZ7_9MICO|nr:phytoene desaturase family protein [Luteimicrobium xylanilyticum]QFU99169.1 All-trans-zeta-carotene desaturase [Luteimicrobium xylanilyticum]
MSRIVVVGAGVAGLGTAALLAQEGHDVAVVERQPTVGGRIGVWREGGFTFDLGPSWYLMPEVFDRFFAALGTTAQDELDLVELPTAFRAFFDGAPPLDVTRDVGRTVAAFEAREPGAGARLEAYLGSAGRTYRTAVDRFLYSDYASASELGRVVRGLGPRDVAELFTLVSTSLWRRTGRVARDDTLRQVLAYPAVFLGASPYQAPALYHLMSHLDLVEGVRYPRGGFGTLATALERLAVERGATVRTRTEVERVLVEPLPDGGARCSRRRPAGRASGVLVRDLVSGAVERLEADVVVAAGDLHHTETRLVPGAYRTYPERWWRRRDPGPGAVLVCLGVRGSLDGLAHHSLVFTADWQRNFDAVFGRRRSVPDPASYYVCRPSATDPTVAPPGHENLFVLVPVPADPGLTPDDPRVTALVDRVVADLGRRAGADDLDGRVVVRRVLTPSWFAQTLHAWSGGALGPAHTLRQSALLRGRNASSKVAGLVYAGGSTIPGVGLPMCLISAELAARRVAASAAAGDHDRRDAAETVS